MSVHKVPQDVEAEDKLLGPFTFRQFIYLFIAAFAILVAFLLAKVHLALAAIPLPFILLFLILGLYHREDQPVETYLLAAVNFFIKPKQRLWDSKGLVEGVKLAAPPKILAPANKSLAAERGQLQRLAHIMDTRGWAIKRPELTEPQSEQINTVDRLAPAQLVTQEPLDIHQSDDLLDPVHFRDAQKFTELAETSTKQARAQAIAKMQDALSESKEPAAPAEGATPKTQSRGQPTSQLPQKVKFNPYPAMSQHVVSPHTGKLQTKAGAAQSEAAVPTPVQAAVRSLAYTNQLPISGLASHAQKLVDGAIPIVEGQEISLHAA